MRKRKRSLAAPFVVTVTSLGLTAGCGSSVTGTDSDGAGGGGTGGAGGSTTGVGTSTGTATETGTATFTDTGTDTSSCSYHPAADCSGVADGVPCSDEGAYCTVQIMCGSFPELSDHVAVCTADQWYVSEDPSYFPSCMTATSTANPPAPCPCDEPLEGTECGHLFGQEQPCTYTACEQFVCDQQVVGWSKENTCG